MAQIPTSHHYEIMKRSRHICAAAPNGVVDILDSTTFNVLKSWNAHSALINDMDAQHDYIVTCGYSIRPGGAYMYDSYVNVFNLKTLTTLKPVVSLIFSGVKPPILDDPRVIYS